MRDKLRNSKKILSTLVIAGVMLIGIIVYPIFSNAAEWTPVEATDKIAFDKLATVSTTDGSYYHEIDINNYGKNMTTYYFRTGADGYVSYNDFYDIDMTRVSYQKKIAVTPGTVINVLGATTDDGEGGSDTTNSAKIYWNIMEWDANGKLVWDAGWLDSSKEWTCGVDKDGTSYGFNVKARSEVRYITLIFRIATGDHSIGAIAPDIKPEELKAAYANLYLCYKPFVYTVDNQGTKKTVNRYGISSIDTPFNICTKTGYQFDGWKVTSNNTVGGKNWMNGKVFTSAQLNDYVRNGKFYTSLFGDTTFTASFSPLSYTVTFNANGGSVSTSSKSVSYGSKYNTLPTPTNDGYSFSGWYTSPTGGTLVTADTVMNLTSNHALYARWSPITYTITFDKQGGTGGTSSITAQQNKPVPYADKPSKDGYVFKGYYTSANGSGTKIYDAAMIPQVNYTYSNAITVYAHWVDETPPTLVLKGLSEWTNQADVLTADASDTVSNLASITIYRINSDGSETQVASTTNCGVKSKKLTYSNTVFGITRYKAVAKDTAGNTATAYVTSYYDNVAPDGEVIKLDISGTRFDIEINVTDVTN